ncbi:MAG: nitrilase [Deltaproteobacteria bacterium]|jgi:N-carbamoylputrescine amidase|nr:nitrilase [Deltaproteobacteria bacterium]
MNDIKIAAAIFNSPVGKNRENLDRMAAWIAAAGKQGAEIICFPELCITGYCTRDDIRPAAEPIPGPSSQYLVQLARDNQISILAGLAERDESGNIFASQLVVTPEGALGVYRKIHIAPPERDLFLPGKKVPLFEISGSKIGVQLCYDAHFPDLSTCMAVEGADILFLPHASPRGTPNEKYNSWMRHLTARAFDNGIFIVACNQTGDNQNGLRFPGVAVMIGPDGQVLDKQLSDMESILVVDLKSEVLAAVRNHRMRYFLPNRRPNIYQSRIDMQRLTSTSNRKTPEREDTND